MLTEIADIYVRLSSEDRDKKNKTDESESIQNQKTMLINYCIEKGWQINGIYCDEDYSGADASRPAWNQVLKDCEEGRCTIVVCKTQSRFSRDMEMIEHFIHGKFPEWGVRFVAVVDNIDTNVKGNKKTRQINGLVNEWQLEELSDNVKATLSVKRKNGEFIGSFAPYGYLIDPDNKNHLIIDEVAAPTVQRIFDLYIGGLGYISIAKILNDEMIPPPCVHKKELGSFFYVYVISKIKGMPNRTSLLLLLWSERFISFRRCSVCRQSQLLYEHSARSWYYPLRNRNLSYRDER